MSELQRATGTPEKILTGYGTVRSPELKVLDDFIEEDTSLSAVKSRFGRPDDTAPEGYEASHIEECIKFLHTLDIIDRSSTDILTPLNRDIFPELSFEPRLLHHIRSQHGDAYQLAEIHDLVIDHTTMKQEHGVRRLNEETLIEKLKEESKYSIQWRSEKTSMWANLLDPIGAISYSTAHNEIITSPTRPLLYELLTYHNTHRDNPNGILNGLKWIHENFLPVFYEVSGTPRVHVAVADTLDNMVNDETLTLIGMTDRTQTVRLPYTIDETTHPAEFELNDPPSRPAYWYPLDRNERRLSQ